MSSETQYRNARVTELFNQLQRSVDEKTDRNFALLMILQFLCGVAAAIWISPYTWEGAEAEVHSHVWASIFLGGLITGLPVFFALAYPGHVLTRHVIAVGQMLMGALLIHLTGGRIETHFHVFGSLAFLAFYRDWKVLLTATAVVALDHCVRGMVWPRSIFGDEFAHPLRWMEHVGWVLFEDLFLCVSIRQSVTQMWTRAEQQARLENSMSDLESERDRFFDLSVDMLCVANLDGFFERVNPMFSEVLGYSAEQLLDQPFYEFIHPEDRESTTQAMGQLQHGGNVVDFENRYRCSDGHYVWLSWSTRAPRPGELLIYAVARDVTARKKAAADLEHARKTAEHARVAAEQASRAKSDFLANMSHEIRTPMNAVIGLTELLLESDLNAMQRDYLTTVLESGESLLSIINGVLDFSKIEAGKIALLCLRFGLRDELGDTMRSLALRAHQKDLELTWYVESNVPDSLQGDPVRLRQVLVNLVENAIKFTERGEVVLWVSSESATDQEAYVRFEIRDTGIGIAREKQTIIFNEFEQADTSKTREFGGTGLGLSISSRLVDLMGGEIHVASETNKGSVFYFTLPFDCSGGPTEASMPAEIDVLQNMRVMIVDDNATNRNVLEETVKGWGMTPTSIDSAAHAIEALKQMRLNDMLPSVILVDVHMPKKGGYELVDELRRTQQIDADTAVITLSSGGQTDHSRDLAQLEIAAQLSKPLKPSELLEKILSVVSSSIVKVPQVDSGFGTAKTIPCLEILLAEDGLANQKLATGLLSKWGHNVSIATNGVEVIEQWESGRFDLILMDLQMPKMDGVSATQAIRAREQSQGGHVPIIAITAHALKKDRELCLQAGMDGYISKPVRQKDLFDALQPIFSGF